MNDDNAISVSGLVKTFGKTRALDGPDLYVWTGGVRGFLGASGAGKSPSVRVLLGPVRGGSGARPDGLASEGTATSGPSGPAKRMARRSSRARPGYDGPYESKTNPGEK